MLLKVNYIPTLGDVEVISPLHPSRPREVALVRIGEVEYVLKSKSVPSGLLKQAFVNVQGHPEIVREVAVYRAWSRVDCPTAQAPELIYTDEKFFVLLEYIPGEKPDISNAVHAHRIAKALVEFQVAPLAERLPRLGIRQPIDPTYWVLKRMWSFRDVLPIQKIYATIRRLRRKRELNDRSYLMHNDLNSGNVIISPQGRVVFIDFASVTSAKDWLFRDIVALALGRGEDGSGLQPVLVEAYLQAIEGEAEFSTIDPSTELRMALLQRILARMQFRRERGRTLDLLVAFLKAVLLDDAAYEEWFNSFRAQGRQGLTSQAGVGT